MLGTFSHVKYKSKPLFKLTLRKKRVKKKISFRNVRVGQTFLRLAQIKFGFLSKTSKIDTFLNKFVSLTLKAEKHQAIKKLIFLKTYRGSRHQRRLPVRGQSARTNAKTRRKRGVN
jgi:ribosomal protein S13